MIYIYTACCSSNSFENVVNHHVQYIPSELVKRMNGFKFKQDSYRFLLGKLLLVKAVKRLGYTDLTLEHLCLSKFSKPYFAHACNIDFNISHSGDHVVCAISDRCRVGIDLEKIEYIDIENFAKYFTEKEWICINISSDSTREFYRFWTRKEAVVKADGRGLHIPLLDFEIVENYTTIQADHWYVDELVVSDGYIAHIAFNSKIKRKYTIQHIVF